MDQRQQVEAESAEASSTQCKKIQKWDETTRIEQEIWLPSEVDSTFDPKRFSWMLGTDAMEPDKECSEGAAQLKATNIAFLGIVPDVTHEWIATVIKEIGDIRRNEAQRGMATMPHSIVAEARADLKDAWQRIQATLMTGAEMMQLAIKARMRQLKKDMEKTYETTLERVFRAKPPVPADTVREQERFSLWLYANDHLIIYAADRHANGKKLTMARLRVEHPYSLQELSANGANTPQRHLDSLTK